ncbi:SDR family NAD(P)-dependent oxidoreductase [Nakamurella endophytica]|uniref:3-oxoacyl-ACP reductase n=1 Tax=Nakamurella endophytica TaxID=1748367 RepID=A0A917SW57_9ACTN|nr:SDR family oxidoreductase [Nakamurella endophytica]GGL99545.1 3-oxoacyl-ACP reductase [Nakamurella endophytica]
MTDPGSPTAAATVADPTGDLSLAGRIAVVTGSGQGIGSAVARRLAAAGAHVVGLDRAEPAATTEAITAAGGTAHHRVCDMADPAAVRQAFRWVDDTVGPVDVLVNNAARGSHTLPAQLTVEELTGVLAVNVVGYFLAAQQAHRAMARSGGGAVVNISSIAGSTALGRGNFAYSVSKGAVEQLTRELAVEWAADGVRVNAVAPSQVRTEGFAPLLTDPALDGGSVGDRMLRGVPLHRLAEPGEIAAVVHFLASDAARFVTGAVVPVDGGNLALNAGGTVGTRTEVAR